MLPNGQIADCSTALKETLLAVKDVYEANMDHAGIACAMKNAGVGVGLPDKGRCKLVVRDGMVELYAAASDIGQGCATVFLQVLSQTTGLPRLLLRNMGANSEVAPDSGTTSGSRQTLITGEAVRMAAVDLKADMDKVNGDLSQLEGKEYFAEFFDPTDKLGSDKPNPKSHVAYGFATHVVILDDEGQVKEVYAAHDSGKVVNPTSIQGQIEGGVLHPRHLCGEGGAAALRLRRQGYRRDRYHPHSSGGPGGLLRQGSHPAYQPAHGEHLLQKVS